MDNKNLAADVTESGKIKLISGLSGNTEMLPETEMILEMLKGLDWDIACSSEKLMNLDLCITDMSLGENDPMVYSTEKSRPSDEQSEKTLALDLSLCYVGSEVIELGRFLDSLQVEVTNVYEKISLFENEQELATLFVESLGRLDASLKPLQQKVQEMKKQLGILQRIRSFGQSSSYMFAEEKYEVFKPRSAEEQLVVSELQLDIKLAELRKTEDELKSKLLMVGETASCIEESAELTWLRLLEAENLAEVFKGMAGEMSFRLHGIQFSLNGSLQREEELKCHLQACHKQHEEAKKDDTDAYLREVNTLKEKVKLSEEKLESLESMLRKANASSEASDQALFEMENFVLSMKENTFAAESRADAAEAKVAELMETNMELSEELDYLKGVEINAEKIWLLEKQVRDSEKQLQQGKASSEGLYAAIWDMETLIEDLKHKASIADARSESTEDKCLTLAETNSELNKDISNLKSRAEDLESSLKDMHRRKGASAKDINNGAKVITDLVMQIAVERERIQKQLYSLARENMILMEELRKSRKELKSSNGMKEDNGDVKQAYSSMNGLVVSESESAELPDTSNTSDQATEMDNAASNESEEGSSTSPEDAANATLRVEASSSSSNQVTWNLSRTYILISILVTVLASAATLLMYKEENFSVLWHRLGL